ncbi:hypothetical protein SAY86_001695 [Trapa natans]|uniref:Uncharacterized protein n=1 Tax=Trapa natans TaxID=22666 RepID=A0AAN7LES7_TRANT|nr:hypothetical protein SAY86_001695 [Trapa natans]
MRGQGPSSSRSRPARGSRSRSASSTGMSMQLTRLIDLCVRGAPVDYGEEHKAVENGDVAVSIRA